MERINEEYLVDIRNTIRVIVAKSENKKHPTKRRKPTYETTGCQQGYPHPTKSRQLKFD